MKRTLYLFLQCTGENIHRIKFVKADYVYAKYGYRDTDLFLLVCK